MKDESVLSHHSAAASAAGFLFQFRRALQVLASVPGDFTLGIETLDDLSISDNQGNITLEQDKFTSLKSGGVYSDSSHNLLNTLSTWLEALLNRELSLDKCKFLLVTNAICRDGLVTRIANANNFQTANNCLDEIKNFDNITKEKQRICDLIKRENGDMLFCEMCTKIELVDGSVTSFDDACTCIQLPSAYESQRTGIFESMVGWLNNLALETWERGGKLLVTKQCFINQQHAILDRIKRERRRERPEYAITLDEGTIEEKRSSTFVRQIDLVTDDEVWQTEAIKDYLRCIIEKYRLSKEGTITGNDWQDFTDILKKRWQSIFGRNNRLYKGSEEDSGFKTMSEVLDPEYRAILAGELTTQSYLTNGSYHRLSDEKTIGWHPRYQQLLIEEGEGNDGRTI
ncbi:MAG: hypothetical protein IKP58_17290 [Victivallales bacterium]|nr:hypothetical protein [Victivallales bacterium]